MEWDDIVYLTLLFGSIGFGYPFGKIADKESRKWISTGLGFLIVFIVSGFHILHPIICTLINAAIILFVSKRVCHIWSFLFTFSYLIFFRTTEYVGIPYPPAHTNLVQMMLTLKLVGLAFEVHDAATLESKKKDTDDSAVTAQQEAIPMPSDILEVFHYAFCYVGVLTGPYYSYRTYHDWLTYPFAFYVSCQNETLKKLKYVPMYALLFLIASTVFPLKYAESEEFYNERSVLYRIWYLTPTFFIFRMRIYTGLVLSECVCTMAGLGAYPEFTDPQPGLGPKKDYTKLKQIAEDENLAKKEVYNFEAIHNINPYGADFVPTFREGMKNWNMCVQYWLAVNVYKRLPRNQFRTLITMFVSALWHGVYSGYYLCLCSAPMYLPVEDLYVKVFRKHATGMAATVWDFFLWFFKMQAFSYMAIAFLLLRIDLTLHYWSSIYYAGHVVAIFLYVVGVFIAKTYRRKDAVSNKVQ